MLSRDRHKRTKSYDLLILSFIPNNQLAYYENMQNEDQARITDFYKEFREGCSLFFSTRD